MNGLDFIKQKIKHKLKHWLLIIAVATIALGVLLGAIIASNNDSLMAILTWQQQQENCQAATDDSGGLVVNLPANAKSTAQKAIYVAQSVGKSLDINPALVYGAMYQETGFNPNLSSGPKDHNLSGIKYMSYMKKYGAKPGGSVGDGNRSGSYASFPSWSAYAECYRDTLKADLGGKKPKTAHDFAKILYDQHYYEGHHPGNAEANIAEYAGGISAGMRLYKKLLSKTRKVSYQVGQGGEKIVELTAHTDKIQAAQLANSDEVDSAGCPVDSGSEAVSGDWTYPFAGIKGTPQSMDGGQFGHTSYSRGSTNFHDGFDFSFGLNGVNTGSIVQAVTDGKIFKVGHNGAAGYYVWEIAGDYNIIYQEGFTSNKISVHKGQHVKIGQKLGTASGTHLHLGITTEKKNPGMRASGSPVLNGFDHPNNWLNPIKVISGAKKPKAKKVSYLPGKVKIKPVYYKKTTV